MLHSYNWRVSARACVLVLATILMRSATGLRFRRRVEYYPSPPPGAIIARPFSLYSGPPFLDFYEEGPPGPPSRRRPPQRSLPRPPTSDEYPRPPFEAAPNELESDVRPEWESETGGWEALLAASQVNAMLSTMTRDAEPEHAHSRPVPSYARRPPRRPAPDYEAESVDGLPLSDRGVRPAYISSYSVPHYSVTSDSVRGGSGGHSHKTTTPPTSGESGGGGGGESKLKAVAIWTHRSRGTAYTLHSDGSLTPERPLTR